MTKDETDEQLRNLGFVPAGEIVEIKDQLRFVLSCSDDRIGWVYAWIEKDGQSAQIVYVGKAGGTFKARCAQHSGGFRASTTGRKHAERLRRRISLSRRYHLFVRKASIATVLGEQAISMESVEEIALIKKFNPKWNAL